MTDRPLPLTGVRVLELAQIVAGPFCGTLMAEFGAEVIKTELPGKGDDLRRLGPTEDGVNYWFAQDNRGKKVITLDLHTPKGQEIVRRLVPMCDVVIENFRPGVLESWGLGWEELSALRPSLIMARITAFGQTGPLRQGPGFAAIASAFGGTWYVNGPADHPPSRPTPVYPDYLTGLFTAFGVMAALRHRDATGEGQWIDAALYESAFRILEYTPTLYGRKGVVRERGGIQHSGWPGGAFQTGDGRFIVFTAPAQHLLERDVRHARPARPAQGPALHQPRGPLGEHGGAARHRHGVVRVADLRRGPGEPQIPRRAALADHEHGRHLRRPPLPARARPSSTCRPMSGRCLSRRSSRACPARPAASPMPARRSATTPTRCWAASSRCRRPRSRRCAPTASSSSACQAPSLRRNRSGRLTGRRASFEPLTA